MGRVNELNSQKMDQKISKLHRKAGLRVNYARRIVGTKFAYMSNSMITGLGGLTA